MKERGEVIASIRSYSDRLLAVIAGLTDEQLTTAYVAGEWTVAQNVHHVADAAANLYTRARLCLTEDYPTIRPFEQDDWAILPDATLTDFDDSLMIIQGVHGRVATLAETLSDEQWARKGYHPDNQSDISVESVIRKIDWHSEAHIEQIGQILAVIEKTEK